MGGGGGMRTMTVTGGGRSRGGNAFSFGRAEGDQATHALGLNYSDKRGNTTYNLSASGNLSVNNSNTFTLDDYVTQSSGLAQTRDSLDSRFLDRNLRLTGRLDTPLSARTTLLVTGRASYQGGSSNDSTFARTFGPSLAPRSTAFSTCLLYTSDAADE